MSVSKRQNPQTRSRQRGRRSARGRKPEGKQHFLSPLARLWPCPLARVKNPGKNNTKKQGMGAPVDCFRRSSVSGTSQKGNAVVAGGRVGTSLKHCPPDTLRGVLRYASRAEGPAALQGKRPVSCGIPAICLEGVVPTREHAIQNTGRTAVVFDGCLAH